VELGEFAPFLQLGAAGILLATVAWMLRALVRGDWVSRRELDYVREDRDSRLKEKDSEISEWRAAYETERTGREVVTDQNRELISGFGTVTHTLDALRAVAEGTRHVGP